LYKLRPLFAFVFAGVLVSCGPTQSQGSLTIGAAANLAQVFPQIGQEFEKQTRIHPVFSFASTAQLAHQIENSAPFDVFAAADSEHVGELERKGLIVPRTRAVYARGVLALWIPAGSKAHVSRIEDLTQPDVHVIAIAKPEFAPYGLASVQTLEHLGIWKQVRSKVVYAENINMAKQYGTSNNADAVFTAYSLVLHESGKTIRVDENLHQPIDQELGIIAKSTHIDNARKFVDFLLNGRGKEMLSAYGYETDNSRSSHSAL
jgi:molybdate transport system substrate-binding protein